MKKAVCLILFSGTLALSAQAAELTESAAATSAPSSGEAASVAPADRESMMASRRAAMQDRMAERTAAMETQKRIEERLANIEALLRELVELQKQK